jgi:hypothetical protein
MKGMVMKLQQHVVLPALLLLYVCQQRVVSQMLPIPADA